VKFLIGSTADLGFVNMITNPTVNVVYLAIAVVLGSATAKERDEQASRLLCDALGALDW
jgi:hypothetical protein